MLMVRNINLMWGNPLNIIAILGRGVCHLMAAGLTTYFAVCSYVDGYNFFSLYWLTVSLIAVGTIPVSESLLNRIFKNTFLVSLLVWSASWFVYGVKDSSLFLSAIFLLLSLFILAHVITEGAKLYEVIKFLNKKHNLSLKFAKHSRAIIFMSAFSVFLFCLFAPKYLGSAKAEDTIKAVGCLGTGGDIIHCYNHYLALEMSHAQDNSETFTVKGSLNFVSECKGFAKKYVNGEVAKNIISITLGNYVIKPSANKVFESQMLYACEESTKELSYTILLQREVSKPFWEK
jgi:hypothetical protein